MRSLSTFRTVFIIVVCLLTLGSMRAMSQTPAGQAHVGEYTQSDITRGSQLYAEQCAVCHGLGGNAVFSVDLRLGRFRTAVSDDDLKRVVRSGVPTAGMPPSTLGDQDLTALVAFIRAGMDVRASATPVSVGDAARGKAVFEGDKANCQQCHRVNGRGGRSGPDLSDIGSIRTPNSIYSSLLNPTNAMLPINRPVRIVTRDGRTVVGRRLNEDTYTLLLADDDGRLVAIDKTGLREFEIIKTSPMPSYKDRLGSGELADVFAYLLSLRDRTSAPPFGRGGRGAQ
jgi:putative heme-binding domain-containing protein